MEKKVTGHHHGKLFLTIRVNYYINLSCCIAYIGIGKRSVGCSWLLITGTNECCQFFKESFSVEQRICHNFAYATQCYDVVTPKRVILRHKARNVAL